MYIIQMSFIWLWRSLLLIWHKNDENSFEDFDKRPDTTTTMGNYLGGSSAQGTSFKKSELLLKQDGALFEIWKGAEVDVSGQEKPVTIFYFDGAQATQEKVALVKNAINVSIICIQNKIEFFLFSKII